MAMSYDLQLADAHEYLKTLPDGSIDAVITDPPYNASKSKITFASKGYKAIDESWDKAFSPLAFLPEVYRALKPNGSLIIFSGYRTLAHYLAWQEPRQILHWRKTNAFPAIAKVYTFSVEYILWYTKGSPYTFNKSLAGRDVLDYPICGGLERTKHPTQKPLELMRRLVSVHSNPGDTILDPFTGSGTTGVAALETGRNFKGCEIDASYHAAATRRLDAVLAQGVLQFA